MGWRIFAVGGTNAKAVQAPSKSWRAKCARQNKCIDLTEKLKSSVRWVTCEFISTTQHIAQFSLLSTVSHVRHKSFYSAGILTKLKGFRDYVCGTVAGWAVVDSFVKLLETVKLYNSLTDKED